MFRFASARKVAGVFNALLLLGSAAALPACSAPRSDATVTIESKLSPAGIGAPLVAGIVGLGGASGAVVLGVSTFRDLTSVTDYEAGVGGLTLGDVNGDGSDDIIIGRRLSSGGFIQVFDQNGADVVRPGLNLFPFALNDVVAAGDLDNDGLHEAIVGPDLGKPCRHRAGHPGLPTDRNQLRSGLRPRGLRPEQRRLRRGHPGRCARNRVPQSRHAVRQFLPGRAARLQPGVRQVGVRRSEQRSIRRSDHRSRPADAARERFARVLHPSQPTSRRLPDHRLPVRCAGCGRRGRSGRRRLRGDRHRPSHRRFAAVRRSEVHLQRARQDASDAAELPVRQLGRRQLDGDRRSRPGVHGGRGLHHAPAVVRRPAWPGGVRGYGPEVRAQPARQSRRLPEACVSERRDRHGRRRR